MNLRKILLAFATITIIAGVTIAAPANDRAAPQEHVQLQGGSDVIVVARIARGDSDVIL